MAPACFAQPPRTSAPPPCTVSFKFTGATGTSQWFDNRFVGCSYWTFAYSPYLASAVSITMQAAPDLNGAPDVANLAAFGATLTTTTCTSGVCSTTAQAGAPAWFSVAGTFTFSAGGFVIGSAIGQQPGPPLSATIPGAVTVSGTVTANQGSANATPWNENLKQVGGAAFALGQTTMSASEPVTIASDQSAVPGNITKVGGSSLALGQTTMAASVPVVIPSNQSTLNTLDKGLTNQEGTTFYDSTATSVPNSLTALTASKTWVQFISCANTTAGATTLLVQDTAGTNVLLPTVTVAANQVILASYGRFGIPITGIKWQAGGSSIITCQVVGSQ